MPNNLTALALEARETMNAHGLAHWSFAWDRAVRRMGCCDYRKRTISLSAKLVQRAPLSVIRNTILHEIAHAQVGPGHGHNHTWKRAARAIGCTAERCYDGKAVEAIAGRWQAVCPTCAHRYHKHRMLRPNAWRYCGRCGSTKGRLTFVDVSQFPNSEVSDA